MPESIYSKTLLKRFQVSLKEKPYENNQTTTNNYNNNIITKSRENKDVSPIRAISDLRKNAGSGAERKREISISQEDNAVKQIFIFYILFFLFLKYLYTKLESSFLSYFNIFQDEIFNELRLNYFFY